jgi:hypothetical protein
MANKTDRDRGGPMSQEGRDAVEDWFGEDSWKRLTPRRVHGVTPDWLISELVRRPGDDTRQTGTSLTRRTEEPPEEAPGAGEWHGATHKILPAAPRVDLASLRHWDSEADRSRAFAQALEEQEVDPSFMAGVARGAVDSAVGFTDRRFQGRRHRATNDDEQWKSHRYPDPGPTALERYRSW